MTGLVKFRIVRSVEIGKVSKKAAILGGIVVLGVVLAIIALSGGKQPAAPSPAPPLPPPPVEPVRLAYHPDASLPPVRLARAEPPSKLHGKPVYKDEASLMAKIRELESSDPELSLKLAREDNERYPNSPDAAERAWFICRSLTGLGRFEEARAEALNMVQKYPGTSWTSDVQRHVLSNPEIPPTAP